MIIYKYADLFQQDSIDKQLIIEFDNMVITNEDLFDQTMILEESLCSENELRFGSCEASVLKIKIANIVAPMKDKWITVKMVLEGHTDELFIIGRYKVEEDKLTADRMWRDIIAYDAMYDIINADATEVAAWYNSLLPDKDDWITMRSFRTSFMRHFGIEQKEIELVNDYAKVERTIDPKQMSGLDVIFAICEMNGCFGHIGRDGKFHYIYLPQDIEGIYPANDLYPSNDLFPVNPKSERVGANGTYIGQPQYENFICQTINKIQIRQKENDIGKIYPDTPLTDKDNSYIIEDNFLLYGKSSEELLPIARNILSKITNITYRPLISADVKGNPCFEVGDPIRISTKYELVETYILERTLKGIQALRDAYSSNGVEKYTEQVNSVHKSIIQLKGKSNVLERTIEETRLEMADMDAGLKTEISITAKGLNAEIKRAKEAEGNLRDDYTAKITATAEELTTEFTAELETWDTSGYDISYSGKGEPKIPVEDGKYYLDEESGAIYWGNVGKWVDAAVYEWKDAGRYYIRLNAKPEYENVTPYSISLSDLTDGTYPNVSTGAPDDGDEGYSAGDVWIEVTYMPPLHGDTLYYWICKGDTGWQLIDYATVMTLPKMASKINQTVYGIELKVSKGDVTSQLLIEPTDIYLKTGRLRIETDNLEINKDGSSGEILSRNLSEDEITKETARYIKFNTGGLEGGYGNDAKCKIVCNNEGLEFRGKILTFCMDRIKVGEGMDSASLKTAYTGDIKYAVKQTDGTISNAVLQIRNGLIMAND